jgi:hypothetical protein
VNQCIFEHGRVSVRVQLGLSRGSAFQASPYSPGEIHTVTTREATRCLAEDSNLGLFGPEADAPTSFKSYPDKTKFNLHTCVLVSCVDVDICCLLLLFDL